MQKHHKIDWLCNDDSIPPEPLLETIECPRCGWKHAIPPEFIDWEEIAGKYEQALKEMSESYWKSIEEASEVFDVPLKEWFEAKKQHFLLELEEIFNELKKRKDDAI